MDPVAMLQGDSGAMMQPASVEIRQKNRYKRLNKRIYVSVRLILVQGNGLDFTQRTRAKLSKYVITKIA